MELDEATLNGHWATNNNNGMEFFIINDAIFSKLCILGEDVEPCFEGSSITAPQVSSSFSKVDKNFMKTLFTMMQELQFALEGGKNMELEEQNNEIVTEEENQESVEMTSTDAEEASIEEPENDPAQTEFTEEENNIEEEVEAPTEEENITSEEEMVEEETEEVAVEEEPAIEETFSLEDYNSLKASYSELESKYNELLNFKEQVELKEKESLIDSFYMLSEEDKKDVKENINKYSKDDIEAKLSIICVRKKVNFEQDNLDKNDNMIEEENPTVTTFNVETDESAIPAWISACINTQNSKNN